MYSLHNGYNTQDVITEPGTQGAITVYHAMGTGQDVLDSILKTGLKPSGVGGPHYTFGDIGHAESVFFRNYKSNDLEQAGSARYIGVNVAPQAMVAHQEYRVNNTPKHRYVNSLLRLDELQELNARKQGGNI